MVASCARSYGYATIATYPVLTVQVYAIDYTSHRLTILVYTVKNLVLTQHQIWCVRVCSILAPLLVWLAHQ